MNQEGQRGTKTVGTQRNKNKKRVWNVVSGEGCVAGQGWGRGRGSGNGPKQNAITSHLHLFLITHSNTLPGTVFFFFPEWDMQGHQKLEIDHWTAASSHDRPAERGCLLRLSRGYSSPTEGALRESRQSTQIRDIWGGKKLHQCVMIYARLLCK